jgi:hypothetical protein
MTRTIERLFNSTAPARATLKNHRSSKRSAKVAFDRGHMMLVHPETSLLPRN